MTLSEFIFKIVKKVTEQLYEKMLRDYNEERQQNINNFKQNHPAIQAELIAELEKYLAVRKEKYNILARQSKYGTPKPNVYLHSMCGHEKYFSKQKSDLASLGIYEYSLDLINSIVDIDSAKDVLESLTSLRVVAYNKSHTQSKHINNIIGKLKNNIECCDPLNKNYYFAKSKFIEQVSKPQEKFISILIKLLAEIVNRNYVIIFNKNPLMVSYYVKLYAESRQLDEAIRNLSYHIYSSYAQAADAVLGRQHDYWEDSMRDMKWVKSAAEELYTNGLKKIPERKELEKLKVECQRKLDEAGKNFNENEKKILQEVTKINNKLDIFDSLFLSFSVYSTRGNFFNHDDHNRSGIGRLSYRYSSLSFKDSVDFLPKPLDECGIRIGTRLDNKNLANQLFDMEILNYISPQEVEDIEKQLRSEVTLMINNRTISNPVSREKTINNTNIKKFGLFAQVADNILPKSKDVMVPVRGFDL